MEGQLLLTKFKTTSTSSNALRWIDVLKKHIGKKISSNNSDLPVTCLTAGMYPIGKGRGRREREGGGERKSGERGESAHLVLNFHSERVLCGNE